MKNNHQNDPIHYGPKRAKGLLQEAIMNRRKIKIETFDFKSIIENKSQFKSLYDKGLAISVLAEFLKRRFQAFLFKIRKTHKKLYTNNDPATKKQKKRIRRQNNNQDSDDQNQTRRRKKKGKNVQTGHISLLQMLQQQQESSKQSNQLKREQKRNVKQHPQGSSSKQGSKKSNQQSRKNLPKNGLNLQDLNTGQDGDGGQFNPQQWEDTNFQRTSFNYENVDPSDTSNSNSQNSSNEQFIVSNLNDKKKILFDVDDVSDKGSQRGGKRTTRRKNKNNNFQQVSTVIKTKGKNMNITLDEQTTLEQIRDHNNTSAMQNWSLSIQKTQHSFMNFYHNIVPMFQFNQGNIRDVKFDNLQQLKRIGQYLQDKYRFTSNEKRKSQKKNKNIMEEENKFNPNYQMDNYQEPQDYNHFSQASLVIPKQSQNISQGQSPDFFTDLTVPTNLFNIGSQQIDGLMKNKTIFNKKIQIKELAKQSKKKIGSIFLQMLTRAQLDDINMEQDEPQNFGPIWLSLKQQQTY